MTDIPRSKKGRRLRQAGTVVKLGWNSLEAAERLNLCPTSFNELVKSHELYKPDNSRTVKGINPLNTPLWSDELLQLIFDARHITPQGIRRFSDDEALAIRRSMEERRRSEYLELVC